MKDTIKFFSIFGMGLLYVVLVLLSCFPGFLHPVLWVYFPVLGALMGAFPFYWIASRWQKFGVGTLLGVMLCLFCIITGEAQGVFSRLMMIMCGVIADIVRLCVGNSSKKGLYISYPFLAIGSSGWIIRLWTHPDWYYENAIEEMGTEYADTLATFSNPLCYLLLVFLTAASSCLGIWLASKALKKSSEKII